MFVSTKTGSAAVVAIHLLAPERETLGEGPRNLMPREVRHRRLASRRGRLLVLDHHHGLIRPRGHVGRQLDRRLPLIVHLDRRLDHLHTSRLRRGKTNALQRLLRSIDHYPPPRDHETRPTRSSNG